MPDESNADLKQQVIDVVRNSKKQLAARDIADKLGLEHRVVKKAITDLVNAGDLEFVSFGGATFLKLPDA
jgi:predicted ArsR family transcriptional regulator